MRRRHFLPIAAWRIVKPTEDGAVTSIEMPDAEGDVIAPLLDARKQAQAEREEWRAIAATIAGRRARAAEAAA